MRVWIVAIGEPLPTDGGNARLQRSGQLAEALVAAGHEVLWWTSTFDHSRKVQRFARETRVRLTDRYGLWLLHTIPYRRNLSVRRAVNHDLLGRRFAVRAVTQPPPDLVFCSWPPIELGKAAVDYGARRGLPTVLDVCDLWPEIFVELAPAWGRTAARVALGPLFRKTSAAFRRATALTAITDSHLEWGLREAGRPRTSLDMVFPQAYSVGRPDHASLARADDFWRNLGIPDDRQRFVACWFGSVGYQSEIETAIRAAGLLKPRIPEARLVLCGAGDRLDHYRRLAAGCDNVLLPGWVGRAEIWSLMRRAAVALSLYRSTCNYIGCISSKIAEYLSSGLPIVNSLQGSLNDLLRRHDCGVSYANGDAAGLASALAALHADPARLRKLARNAGELYRREFVAEEVYGRMERHLAEIANRALTGASHV
jgi:glycosyltransferase involved in cell wall biosynthesis